MQVAETQDDVFQNVDPAAVVALLMHKIAKVASAEGNEEACELLQDWLMLSCSAYNSRASARSNVTHVSKVQN